MTNRVQILGLCSALVVVAAGSAPVAAKANTEAEGAMQGAGKQIPSTRPPSASALPAGYVVVRSGSKVLQNNNLNGGAVTCPPTRKGVARYPQGGGVYISSTSLFANILSSGPGDTSWVAAVNNTSGADTTFEVWAVCATPHTGYVQVRSADVQNRAGTQAGGFQPCPTGTKIIGGGVDSSGSLWTAINSTYPVNNGWHVDMNTTSSGSDEVFDVMAICSKYLARTGYGVVVGAQVNNPANRQSIATANCPAGQVPLSGGVYSSSSETTTNLNTSYPTSGGWTVFENNAGNFDHTITPYVICAK